MHTLTRLSPARRAILSAGLLCGALLLSACGTPYHPPRFADAATAFPGLVDVAAAAEGRGADVLLVHGICSHDASWAGAVVGQLAAAIKVATTSTTAATAAGAVPHGVSEPRVLIVPSVIDTPAGKLRFDALIWSPLTAGLKRQLCYDQSDKSALCEGTPPYPAVRARLNARFKDGLIDDCLPDALIYQGVARDQIRRRMRDAILQALAADDAPSAAPLVVIAHSMGSKILFDTLLAMSEEEPESRAALVARHTMERLRFLVMAANQIPLLSLADQPIAEAGGGVGSAAAGALPPSSSSLSSASQGPAGDSLRLLLQKRLASKTRTVSNLTLVAFTDPNDLLSYTLPPEKYVAQGVVVYNVLVSNAPTWLGLLERPDDAHLDYLSNPDIGRLIACGWPASVLCN